MSARIVNLTLLVTGLLIISSLPEGNNNPADFERSELVGKVAKLIQQSIAKKGLL